MLEYDYKTIDIAKGILEMVQDLPLGPERKNAMDELKARDPETFYATLGIMYDVYPYYIDGEGITESALPHEIGQYFVSRNALDFEDAPIIPLATTFAKSFEIGCKTLNLENLFHRECAAGHELPRCCFATPTPSLDAQLAYTVAQSRQFETMSPAELALKGTEEYGEFASGILIETGAIRHKNLKEPSFGEAADVLLCMIAALAKTNPNLSDEAIAAELARWVRIKQAKYDLLLETKQKT